MSYCNAIKANKREELTKIGESGRLHGQSGFKAGMQRKDGSEDVQTIDSLGNEANNFEFYPPRQGGNILPGKEQLSRS